MISLIRLYAVSLITLAIILTIQCEHETNDTDTNTGLYVLVNNEKHLTKFPTFIRKIWRTAKTYKQSKKLNSIFLYTMFQTVED